MHRRMGNEDEGADKRVHDRKPIRLVVEYEGADDLIGDYTDNLSEGGIFVTTTRQFAIGDQVKLALSFPGLLAPINIEGVVRWSRAGDHEADRGVGIEFDEFDSSSRERVEGIIARIKARDPKLVGKLVKILVVEDNPHVAKLIRDGLRGTGKRTFGKSLSFNFRTAVNGQDALERLANERFDALIIDIYLPILDGVAVITRLRERERQQGGDTHLPIIAVSAGGEGARESALAAGADFFLAKPMRLREVVETLGSLIPLG